MTTIARPDAMTRMPSRLRTVLAGAGAFDASMGVFCLAAPGPLASLLSVGSGTIRATGVVFLLAAVAGAETLLRPSLGVRWVAAANLVFAAWCVGMLAAAGPSAVGAVLLAGAAVTSASTAWLERRLAR
jgi:hypothetical protein